MNLTNKLNYLFLVFFLSVFSQGIYAQSNNEDGIYVWEFATKGGARDAITSSFTEEFEEALIQSQCCVVLQRRVFARLFDQKQNEKAVLGLSGVPAAKLEDLKSLEAKTVVFGEVYDDANSGQVKFSVNFESFDGNIIKKASIHVPKYAINDPSKREEAVEQLMNKLDLFPATKRPKETKTFGDWEFSLTGCVQNGNAVTCGYTVMSKYRDRNFTINGTYNGGSLAYDEFNYEYKANSAKLSNKQAPQYVKQRLIADVQATGQISFANISTRTTKFTMLEFRVGGDDLTEKTIQFRNVPLE